MKFLIQDEVFEGDEKLLTKTLDNQNIDYLIHPNVKYLERYVLDWCAGHNVFAYGSLEWIQNIQRENCYIQTICNLNNFDSRIYYHYYRIPEIYRKEYYTGDLFNEDAVFVTYKELEKIIKANNGIFIRPAAGYKPKGFSGQIVKEFDEKLFDKNESYMVAFKKHIDYEWRTVVANQKFLTGCQYKTYCKETGKLGFDPNTDCPQRVIDYVNKVTERVSWEPDPIYIMDIVESKDRLYIMELNGLSTSGWYDCDYGKIVQSILNNYHTKKN